MQEPKRRKIYSKNTNHKYNNEDLNITSIPNNTYHSHKRKPYPRHSKPKKSKKWHSVKHGNLRASNCVSNYIGPERLTKHVGFLTKGKISDSISRIEQNLSDKLRARANQDLHGILRSVNKPRISCQPTLETGLSSMESHKSPRKNFSEDAFKQNLKDSSPQLPDFNKSPDVFSVKRLQSFISEEEYASAQTITSKLYAAIDEANKKLFPGISNQEILKSDLLKITRLYNRQSNTCSSSSNCESSQDIHRIEQNQEDSKFELNPVLEVKNSPLKFFKDDFELHPILTQESVPKDLRNIFPDVQEISSSSESDIEIDNLSLSTKERENYELIGQDSGADFECKRKTHLVTCSPDSDGAPVYMPILSDEKFIPQTQPTPKRFYRQKMF